MNVRSTTPTPPQFRPGLRPMTFAAAGAGNWRIDHVRPVTGAALPSAPFLDVRPGIHAAGESLWSLRGVAGPARYVERRERLQLEPASPPLGRPESTTAVLIPMTKSDVWWALPQDERRAVFEERSHHIGLSLKYLPAIARGLYHCRDLGEPFDFLAWFEFAPSDRQAFDRLLAELRSSEEWRFVNREVEVWLQRE